MKRVIFINLSIDQIWDQTKNLEAVFPIRLKSSEYVARINENLGIYLSQSGDHVLGFHNTKGFSEFIQQWPTTWGELIVIKANPYDQAEWEAEISRLPALKKLPWLQIESPAHFNMKTLLIELAADGRIRIPPTRILNQAQLVLGECLEFSKPHFLKYNFGSGGGGNFLLENSQDKTLVYLQRRLSEKADLQHLTNWLLQEKIPSSFEGCVFGWSDSDSEPEVCQILYDVNGLSYQHDFQVPREIFSQASAAFHRLRIDLSLKGYHGPMGIDFLISAEDQKLYLVDLNMRWTKTHLLSAAMEKLKINRETTISLRYRWKIKEPITFEGWWKNMQEALKLNSMGETAQGMHFIPYLVDGIESPGPLKEVSIFISKSDDFIAEAQIALKKCENREFVL